MPFRRACVRAGADVTVSEMAMAANLLKGDRREWALVRRHASEACFGVQVCGGYPDLMARCGELLDETTSCDFVDINMGCPIDGVCAKGAGASLFKDEEGLRRCERTVRCASAAMRSTPLTIKIRMGYEDDPARYVAHEVLAKARGWGAAAATLHGRTRQQRYSRDADWKYIERCASVAARDGGGLPLVGNGDVFGWRDYERHMRSGNLATCMIGRGALVKPWVFTEIKERRVWDISATERLAYFERFARDGLEHWGADEKGVETTRRFMLEWMSYTHRYVPVGVLERGVAQKMTLRPMPYSGRNELETLLASEDVADWIAVSEMFLGKPGKGFAFVPKHGSNSYSRESAAALRNLGAGVAEEEEEEAQNG
jgi:tRNA-dihydrouridine synthase 3